MSIPPRPPVPAGEETLFSVITAAYNCAAKIDATAQSVLTQSGVAVEYLVIDGGSTDGTLERLRSYGERVRWISEPDAGIYDAMNKGIRRAHGRFLYFLGAGDHLRPDVLRAVAALLPPAAGRLRMVYGDVHWPGQSVDPNGVFHAGRLAHQNICHQAIFYERGIFDLLGEYDLRYPTCADYALNIRCFGRPEVRPFHLELVVADYEGAGASTAIDHVFRADQPALVRQCLGFGAALRTFYHFSDRMAWARWVEYQLKQPWRRLPGRLWQRLRGRRRAASLSHSHRR